jgi:hypothetical protein
LPSEEKKESLTAEAQNKNGGLHLTPQSRKKEILRFSGVRNYKNFASAFLR